MTQTTHRHIPALDAVRGLAILLVTLYRFRPSLDHATLAEQGLAAFLQAGTRGVDLFFVLSGFLITGILYDARHDPHYFRNFYARRTLRIFPLYYGVLLLTFFVLPQLGQLPKELAEARQSQEWLWIYATNVYMSWQDAWCFGAFDHFWSLAVEEHFYLIWPLVIYLCSRATAIRVSIGLAVLSAVSRIGWCVLGGNETAAEVFTLFRLDALLIGATLALVSRRPQGLAPWLPAARRVAWGSGLLLLPVLVLQKRLLTVPESLFAVFFGALLVLAVTAGAESWFGRFGKVRLLRVFGKYSYGMYVFQKPLIPLLAAWFTEESFSHLWGSPLLGWLSYAAFMFGVTFGVAFLSWHVYEKHFLKLKDRFAPAAPPVPLLPPVPVLGVR